MQPIEISHSLLPSVPPSAALVASLDAAAGGPAVVLATRFSAAFARRAAVIAAVPVDQIVPINVDVPFVLTTVLAAMDGIRARRAEIVARLPAFDVTILDDLEDDVLALGEAHLAWRTATTPPESLPELSAEAMRRRDQLRVHADSLVAAGLLDASSLQGARNPGGYHGMAMSLLGLCRVLRSSWTTFEGSTPLRASDLVEAQAAADRMVRALTARRVSPGVIAAASLTRHQTFTVFVRAYDEVRRAMAYLRWHEGDADAIVPSLYAGRGGRKAGSSSEATPTAAPTGTTA